MWWYQTNNHKRIRNALRNFKNVYNLEVDKYTQITPKCYVLNCCDQEYFFKETSLLTNEKYDYLSGQGISNILYPIKNTFGKFTTRSNIENYYVMPYLPTAKIKQEMKVSSMVDELYNLHVTTTFKRQLSPQESRKRMEDIYEYLEYKFNVIEFFVRSIEGRPFDEYSIVILKNYYIILDTKKELARLQKKIITDIKSKKSVERVFIHNNPKLEHLLINNGNKFLISLEKSKIGITSLDMAKLYLENEDLYVDLPQIIKDYYQRYGDDFYYDYFCFLVMFYYIKGLVIVEKDYVTSQSFINTCDSLRKFQISFMKKPDEKD